MVSPCVPPFGAVSWRAALDTLAGIRPTPLRWADDLRQDLVDACTVANEGNLLRFAFVLASPSVALLSLPPEQREVFATPRIRSFALRIALRIALHRLCAEFRPTSCQIVGAGLLPTLLSRVVDTDYNADDYVARAEGGRRNRDLKVRDRPQLTSLSM